MRRNPIVVVLGMLTTATLSACGDSSDPMVSAALPASTQIEKCKPPTPDHEIPLPIAPPSKRVDLFTPTFTNPTNVRNPLFPISGLSQAILVGAVSGEPLRIETTLMPKTLHIDMGDHVVEVLASQFVAYLGRRIHEYALDRYAQADDGSVWYFGEDVFNYERGRVADTEGTWLACKDGPAAMIMAADPQVGNVWRTENVFGVVFEEITVQAVNLTSPGPFGPVTGVLKVQELHMDGELEAKEFAPGYGEFHSGSAPDFEATALAVPINRSPGPLPDDLRTVLAGARSMFRLAQSGNWGEASNTVLAMNRSWERIRASQPRLLKPLMTGALEDLTRAVAAQQSAATRQAALDARRTGLDLLLQYRSRVAVDLARLDLWTSQLELDTQAGDAAGIRSDLIILDWIRQRLAGAGNERERAELRSVEKHLDDLRSAAERGTFAAVLDGARRLQPMLGDPLR